MTPDELMEGLTQMYRDTSSRVTSVRRAFNTLIRSRSPIGTAIAYAWNRGSGPLWIQKYEHTKEALPAEARRTCLSPVADGEDSSEESPSPALKT
jgi:hypothetical protein